MSAVTRRAFLRSSGLGQRGLGLGGLGLGALAGGGLAGCATAIKGDFAPKTGPRVVVIGGGWGGATAAKYVRLERSRASRSSCSSPTASSSPARSATWC